MTEPGSRNLRGIVGTIVIIGALAALAAFFLSPGQRAKRREQRQTVIEHRLFVAKFDSLCKARLYPVLWRSGTFLTTEFDEERRTWTLTVSPGDWSAREIGSKKDLAARLLTAFSGVRAQAGGDPDQVVLVIKDDSGDPVAAADPSTGTRIMR
jgi:hypothetical protein